jgi:hypothetical protein
MESLRSRALAAERSVRAGSAQRSQAHVNAGGRSRVVTMGATLVVATLLVTNVMTWRALDRERAQRLPADQEHPGPPRSAPFTLSPASQVLLPPPRAAAEASRVPQAASVGAAAPAGIPIVAHPNSNRLAKRLADPASRDALRAQMRGPALQVYGELLSRWHLSGAAADPVLDALAAYQSGQLVDALSPGNRAGVPAPDANAADNDAVRAALNPKQLEELRAFDSALPDRQAIAPLLSELELAQTPLSKDTAEQLITIMHDERVAVPQPTQAHDAQPSADSEAMEQWQTDLDQRIDDRAEFILSSAALAKLEAFQKAQRAATAVFTSALTDNTSTPPVANTNPPQN